MDEITEALQHPTRTATRRALGAIADRRRLLDDLERRAIDAARDAGLSWSDIGTALGLGSRQAAEQRRLRLGERALEPENVTAARRRRRQVRAADAAAGEAVVLLRRRVAQLADAIEVHAPRTHESAAQLAQQTLRAAADGPAGALVDLVRHALADLERIPRSTPSGLGPSIARATAALQAATAPRACVSNGSARHEATSSANETGT